MATRRLGLILSGVTGRIGVNQHLGRAVAALRASPLTLANGDEVFLSFSIFSNGGADEQAIVDCYW